MKAAYFTILKRFSCLLVLVAHLNFGCSDSTPGGESDLAIDASVSDSQSADFGTDTLPSDTASDTADTGVFQDAEITDTFSVDGPVEDATVDIGVPPPDAAPSDAKKLPVCGTYPAGCSSSTWVDGRYSAANRKITWQQNQYQPKCLRILANQSVEFTGLATVPIWQECGPIAGFSAPAGANIATVTFTQKADYGYFWNAIPGNFYRGAIRVE